jgi:hypothetical protein
MITPTKFKVGQIVRIKDCKEIKSWAHSSEVIGKEICLSSYEINNRNRGGTFILFNIKYGINFSDTYLEEVKLENWDE